MNPSPKPDHSGFKYRPDIDGLRAIAVMAVLLCHAGLGMPGGYVGVDVFFVISGYLITSLIIRDLERGRFSMLDFWERRARRILPAMAAMIIAVLVAGWFLLLPDDFVGLGKSVMAVAAFGANIYFWKDTGYFAQAAEEKPLLHTWSLAVEEQFYLFVPVTIMILWHLWHARGLRPAFLVAILLSFCLSAFFLKVRVTLNFYMLPTRAWELLAGSLLAATPALLTAHAPRLRTLAACLGSGMIIAPCFYYTKETPFPGVTAIPPVLGSVLLIWSGSGGVANFISRALSARPVVFVGLISYSLYLVHWPLFAFANYMSVDEPGVGLRACLAAASIPLAYLSWKFIETPFRKRTLFPSRRSVLVAGFMCLASLSAAGAWVWKQEGFGGRLPGFAQVLDRTGGEKTRFLTNYNPKKIPGSFHRLGDRGKPPSLLLWGDSFSWALMPVVDATLREHGLAGYGAGFAATAPVLKYPQINTYTVPGAPERNRRVLDYLRESSIKEVWLVGNWQGHLHVGERQFEDGLKEAVLEILGMGIGVTFVIDPPSYDFDSKRLLVRKSLNGEDLKGKGMPATEYDRQKAGILRLAAELREMGVTIANPKKYLLDDKDPERMALLDPNGSLYTDGLHLSPHGSMRLKPMIEGLLREQYPLAPSNPGKH